MKWLKRVFIFLLFILVAILSSIVFITWKYEDDLKNYALENVRESVVTKVEFDEDVVLSFWKDFPLIAVEFTDLQIQDSFKTDTVLKVQKAFVQFDVLRLLRNDFTIEGIRVSDGFLRLRRTNDDQWNFRVWKTPENKSTDRKTDFSIEILTLENIHLDYDDREVDLNIQFTSYKSKIRGRFYDKNTRLGLSLNGFMSSLTTIGAERIVNLPMELKGILNIDSDKRRYTIETGNAVLADNEMVVNAEWKQLDSGTDMQLQLHAGNIEPSVLLPHIWPQMPTNIKNLNIEGKSDVILSMKGPFTRNSGPKLDATIRMRNGSILFQETQVSNLNFEGKLFMENIKRSRALEMVFDEFSLETPSGSVSGNGKLTDLNNPKLKLKTSGKSRLEELIVVANVKKHVQASGVISWNIDFQGPLGKDFKTTINELKQMQWSGNISLADAAVKFNSGIPELQSLNANIAMNRGKTVFTQCSGKLGHFEFDGNMEIADLKRILTEETSPVRLNGNVHIASLDVSKLPNEWKFESEEKTTTSNRQLSIIVDTEFDEIVYNKFTATQVRGNINMKNNRVDIENLRLNALGGKISSTLSYFPNKLGYMMQLDGELQHIDMSRALAEWDNFGQETVKAENLKGRTSATLEADIQLDKEHQLLKDQLRVETQVEVSGGELIDFEPLLAMSRFIDVDELKRVKFDTLRNQLSIRNSKLHIPNMSISSSVLNVNVFGEHAFNQEMDYHVNLLLNDIIRRKAKKKRTFDGHEIIDKKGKTRLFLWIRGTPNDIKVGYDKKEVLQKIKSDLKKEGQMIKQIFKDEFSKSSTDDEKQEETMQFKLEDDGLDNEPDSPSENAAPNVEKQSKKEKKKKRGFFSSEPEEQETEGSFEIEFEP